MKNIEQLVTLFQRTQDDLRTHAARAVDSSLVVRNWLFGWYLVEFENADSVRSESYGKKLLPQLSTLLKKQGLKGLSTTNLKLCRSFYLTYREIGQTLPDRSSEAIENIAPVAFSSSNSLLEKMGQTLSAESFQSLAPSLIQQAATDLPLSWSHYVTLLTIKDAQERSFYAIEARECQWSLRELKRQLNSSLYERLSLSRDKDAVRKLLHEGQTVGNPRDIVKSPYILEFLGLDEKSAYSETDLESALISKLESFLLELGKGFLFELRADDWTVESLQVKHPSSPFNPQTDRRKPLYFLYSTFQSIRIW